MTCPSTLAVRNGLETDTQHGAVVPPIFLSSNYTFDGFNQKRPYDYTRSGNPTRDLLAETLAKLEGGFGGVITSSGMSAVHLCLSLLKPGDLLLAPKDCYGGTYRLFTHLANKGHFRLEFIDPTDSQSLDLSLVKQPRMIWLETPSNPLLRITDVRAWCDRAAGHDVIVVVDNTFLSPVLQKPIELGADLVVHSTTKYINGHSDVVGGAVVAKTQVLHEELTWWANCLGLTGAPFDSFLTLRGLRSIQARMEFHEKNAWDIVKLLMAHPVVEKVYYPGLTNHPGHVIARRQQKGFGGMVSFELKGGLQEVKDFLSGLKLFSLAESLGGVESLVAHPATMTHASMDPEARKDAGITEQLIRLSVGIEASEDLCADVEQALNIIQATYLKEKEYVQF